MDGIEIFKEFIGEHDEAKIVARGMATVHYLDTKIVERDFNELIETINDKNSITTVRAYGRGNNISKRDAYLKFIAHLLNKDISKIKFDSTNNAAPVKRFYSALQIDKKQVQNYKLSHVWDGMSKNPFAFCALWNMCLTPFFIDPLTGHETKSSLSELFAKEWRKSVINKYQTSIETYNQLMTKLNPKIDDYMCNRKHFQKYKDYELKRIKENFREINLQ